MKRDINYNKYNKDHLLDPLLNSLNEINELIKHPRIPNKEENLRARGLLDDKESGKTMKIRELEEQIRVKDTLITELKDSIAQKDEQLKVLQTNIKTLLDEGCEKINKRIELESVIKELEEKLKEQKEKTKKWKDKAKKSRWKEKAKKYKSMINNNYTEKITNEDKSMRKDLLTPRIVAEVEK